MIFFGFIALPPLITLGKIITTAAGLFAANELLRNNGNQTGLYRPDGNSNINGVQQIRGPEGSNWQVYVQYDRIDSATGLPSQSPIAPINTPAQIGVYEVASTEYEDFRPVFDWNDDGSSPQQPLFDQGVQVDDVATFFIRNLDTGEDTPLSIDGLSNIRTNEMADLVLEATISANVEPTLATISQGIKDIKQEVTQINDKVGNDGNTGNNPDSNTIVNEILINVEADIERVIQRINDLQNYIDSLWYYWIPYIYDDGQAILSRFPELFSLIADNQVQLLAALSALELEGTEVDLTEIRARLEAIFNQGSSIDNDLRLAAGASDYISSIVDQILTTAEETKTKVDTCTGTEEEDEDEDCCDLIEEIHEIVTGGVTSSFAWTESCESDQAGLRQFGGVGFGGVLTGISELGSRLDIINQKICDVDAVAAVPEGWNLRPENQRGQLVVLLDIGKDGKFSKANRQITIPHYSGGQIVPDIAYTSGNSYGMLVLADNSKVRVYASSQGAAEGVCNQILGMISGQYTIGAYVVTGQVKRNIQSHLLRARVAKFYAPGHSPGASPLWVARRPRD